jgi:hypothetical protein
MDANTSLVQGQPEYAGIAFGIIGKSEIPGMRQECQAFPREY